VSRAKTLYINTQRAYKKVGTVCLRCGTVDFHGEFIEGKPLDLFMAKRATCILKMLSKPRHFREIAGECGGSFATIDKRLKQFEVSGVVIHDQARVSGSRRPCKQFQLTPKGKKLVKEFIELLGRNVDGWDDFLLERGGD
jgi:DNA-binding HxlR family transcriptional regulator